MKSKQPLQGKVPVGIIGCGTISGIYAQMGQKFEDVEIVACADLDQGRARALAEKYQIPRALGVDELLADPGVAIVVNLTIPQAHGEVALRALKKDKHVYNEKPLTLRRREAREILGLAREKNLRVGCAPDTFLGGGAQTCRKLIDAGVIGEPVAAAGFVQSRGPEHWHPNPEFYYKRGGGPLFDMGPYYLTTLTALLGPVQRVTASARTSFAQRLISSQPFAGQMIEVEVPTHVSAVLEFSGGPVGTLVTSFDVVGHRLPRIEVYGSEGTLSVPDPNTFGGPVFLLRRGEKDWEEIPLAFGYEENSRGLGVADMANALKTGRDHRANERVAYHVLDVMHTISDAAESGRHLEIGSTMSRPDPLPAGLTPGRLETGAPPAS